MGESDLKSKVSTDIDPPLMEVLQQTKDSLAQRIAALEESQQTLHGGGRGRSRSPRHTRSRDAAAAGSKQQAALPQVADIAPAQAPLACDAGAAAAVPNQMAAGGMPMMGCMGGMPMMPMMGMPGMMPMMGGAMGSMGGSPMGGTPMGGTPMGGMGGATMGAMPMQMMMYMQQQQQMQMMMMQQQMSTGHQRQYEDMLKSIKGGASESLGQAKANDVPVGTKYYSASTSDILNPAYRPPNAETIPGVTDRRWDGKITRWFDDQGYGFIECEELTSRFKETSSKPDTSKQGQDVFLHNNQRAGFVRGDLINFSVFLNFRGKPQATDLRRQA